MLVLTRLHQVKRASVIGYWHCSALSLYRYLYFHQI